MKPSDFKCGDILTIDDINQRIIKTESNLYRKIDGSVGRVWNCFTLEDGRELYFDNGASSFSKTVHS